MEPLGSEPGAIVVSGCPLERPVGASGLSLRSLTTSLDDYFGPLMSSQGPGISTLGIWKSSRGTKMSTLGLKMANWGLRMASLELGMAMLGQRMATLSHGMAT